MNSIAYFNVICYLWKKNTMRRLLKNSKNTIKIVSITSSDLPILTTQLYINMKKERIINSDRVHWTSHVAFVASFTMNSKIYYKLKNSELFLHVFNIFQAAGMSRWQVKHFQFFFQKCLKLFHVTTIIAICDERVIQINTNKSNKNLLDASKQVQTNIVLVQ